MSFFNSLYTGTAGLLAQERSTAVISENIANISTTGYKRQDVAFHELVANNKSSYNSTGGVSSQRLNHISQQGGIQNTSSSTDVAIAGNGFFAVRSVDDPTAEVLYTRNGSFQEDSEGLLRNSAGFILYGWPITDGVVSSGTTTDTLQAIDVDVLQSTSIPTSLASIRLNLDSDEEVINPHTLGAGQQQLPVSDQPLHYSRSIEVYDSNGNAHNLTYEFRAILGPMAHFSSSSDYAGSGGMDLTDNFVDPAGPTPGILDGDMLHISDGANTYDITFRAANPDPLLGEVSTFGEMIDMINSFTDVGGAQIFTATRDSRGELTVQANDPTVTLELTETVTAGPPAGDVLGATGLAFIQDPDIPADYTYEPDADLLADGTANPNQSTFPAFADTTTPNPFHWWEMRILTEDPAGGPTPVEISKGLINFNGDGTLNATPDANGQVLIDLGTVDFDSGDATEDITMSFDISGMGQYAGGYELLEEDQNGTPLGQYAGVEITRDGIVQSIFSNGQRVDTYQIALANFANPNGLERVDGTAFRVTEDSGEPALFQSGLGGTGSLTASALENSNVDISEEFSMMIVNQRAFSLNSRVITTVDEMTEQLAQLKR